jgi:hypothetical protein
MKYMINKLFLSVLFIAIAFACSDDVRIPDFEDGPNVRIIVDTKSAAINFFSDISQAKIKYDLYSENKNIDNVDIRVQRNGTGTPVSIVKFTQADFDNGDGVIKGQELTLTQVAAALNLPGGISGFQGADKLTFFNFTTLTNGVTYPSATVNGQLNLSPTIQQANASTSFTSNFQVNLICPSTIPEGSYTATQTDTDVFFGGPNPLPSTNQVTITKVAGTTNQYLISDISAGGYFECCGASGFKKDQPAIIRDVCLGISVVSGSNAQITIGQGVSAGSWDPTTNTLIVHYDDVSNKSKASGFDLTTKFVKN